MTKYQLTIQNGDDSLTLAEIEDFVRRVGQENVEVLAAPAIVEFWSPTPILRVSASSARRSYFGDEAIGQLRAL